MKVGYFKRHVNTGLHHMMDYSSDCIYIPDFDAVIFTNKSMMGNYSSYEDGDSLLVKQAKSVAKGEKPPQLENSTGNESFSDIYWLEYDDGKVRSLCEKVKIKRTLDTQSRQLADEIDSNLVEIIGKSDFDEMDYMVKRNQARFG